ncbi:MAG: sulfate ABC transporter permease subunit CysW [Gemmataceae bacterium]
MPALKQRPPTANDPAWVRYGLTTIAIAFLSLMVIAPVISVFVEALSSGVGTYFRNLIAPDTRDAIIVSLLVAPCAVVLNVVFGVAAAWSVTRFRFPGRTALLTVIDLPFSISPVVAGLLFVLLFGMQGYFGPWLKAHGISILFSFTALVIATTFVTLPFIARELIPVMDAIGPDEELAAMSLGANGWQIFWRITLPNIKWGLLYGIILAGSRALGEFGAVYVVGGRIAGQTNTLPLEVDQLFQGFDSPAAFAVASLLVFFSLAALILKLWVERKLHSEAAKGDKVMG